jgi:hypothetical protein
MEDLVHTKNTLISDNKYLSAQISLNKRPKSTVEINDMVNILKVEGGEDLYNYSEWLGVTNEPDFIAISSRHHYFFDEEELKNISTIITIKQLNQIQNLGEFFSTIYRLLPSNSSLIGSYVEEKRKNHIHPLNKVVLNGTITKSEALENGIIARNPFFNRIFSFFDSKTHKQMTKETVVELLKSHGFEIFDMTEINGLTYFYAQKVRVVTE